MSSAEDKQLHANGRPTEDLKSTRSRLQSDIENYTSGYGSTHDRECMDDDILRSKASPSSSPSDGSRGISKKEPITYTNLLRTNPNYRFFLSSYLINKMGEWLTYLASISLIQDVTTRDGTSENTNTWISILILVKLLPNVFFLPVGGILADSYDRRKIQIVLDLCSSCVVVVFLQSLHSKSILLCLVANFLIEVNSGLYIPSNQAMLPQLFRVDGSTKGDSDELKKATVLYGMSWSLMVAVGSSLGGVLVAVFGIGGCFVIDSITYLISALILRYGVRGEFNASTPHKEATEAEETNDSITIANSPSSSVTSENLSLLEEQHGIEQEILFSDVDGDNGGMVLFVKGLKFLFLEQPLVGACALLKGSAALSYGAVDVLNVSFSARGSESDPSTTSLKLGVLFGCVGVGCIIGSFITDAFSDLERPRRIARVCLSGFFCIFAAMFWMAATPDIFVSLCASTIIRSNGSALTWIGSTLLIQKLTPQALLGRVSSFDSGVALFAEAVSALGGGMLMDQRSMSAEELSLILAGIGVFFFLIWSPLAFHF